MQDEIDVGRSFLITTFSIIFVFEKDNALPLIVYRGFKLDVEQSLISFYQPRN